MQKLCNGALAWPDTPPVSFSRRRRSLFCMRVSTMETVDCVVVSLLLVIDRSRNDLIDLFYSCGQRPRDGNVWRPVLCVFEFDEKLWEIYVWFGGFAIWGLLESVLRNHCAAVAKLWEIYVRFGGFIVWGLLESVLRGENFKIIGRTKHFFYIGGFCGIFCLGP